MARGQTQHYGLNQWEAADQVLRTDFNADNAKIDAALRALRENQIGAGVITALFEQQNQRITPLEERLEALERGKRYPPGHTPGDIRT